MDSQPERLRHRIGHTAPNPEEAYAASQTNELVSEQIRKLPPALRAPLQLCSVRGLSAADTCQVLGNWPRGAEGSEFSSATQIGGRAAILDPHRQGPKENKVAGQATSGEVTETGQYFSRTRKGSQYWDIPSEPRSRPSENTRLSSVGDPNTPIGSPVPFRSCPNIDNLYIWWLGRIYGGWGALLETGRRH
jgi:hypothetical protein